MTADFWMGVSVGIALGMGLSLAVIWTVHVTSMKALRLVIGKE